MSTGLLDAPNYTQQPAVLPQRQMPVAQVRQAGEFPVEEFTTYPDVPVFKEHETTSKDGRPLRFTSVELQQICDRCNRRIDETGDYAAVTIGHTPDPDAVAQGVAKMPELVGMAGPFQLGMMPDGLGRQIHAILADLHIYNECVPLIKKNPRRSPEVWLEDRYEDMFLDPIALLGAEAPRLDMGLLYSARGHGRRVEKYALASVEHYDAMAGGGAVGGGASVAASPGPGNTFIRSDSTGGRRRHYAAGDVEPSPFNQQPRGSAMLAPEEVQQIVEAMGQLDWVQWCKQQMAGTAGPGAAAAGGAPPTAAGGPMAPPAMAPKPAPTPPGAPAAPGAPPPAAAAPHPGGGAMPPAAPKPAAPPAAPGAGGAPPPKEKDSMSYSAGGDDALDPDADDDDTERYTGAGNCGVTVSKKSYSADGTPTGDVDHDTNGAPAAGDVDGVGGNNAAEPYSRNGNRMAYGRLEATVRKQGAQIEQYKRMMHAEVEKRVNTERYSKLQEKGRDFAFDVDDEFANCKFGEMTDAQFDKHIVRIEQYFKPIPHSYMAPTFNDDAAAQAPSRPGSEGTKEKYKRGLSDRAFAICERRALNGQDADYADVLQRLQAGEKVE